MKLQLLSLCFIALVAQSHVTQAFLSLTPIKSVVPELIITGTSIVGNAVNTTIGVVTSVATLLNSTLDLIEHTLRLDSAQFENTLNSIVDTLTTELDNVENIVIGFIADIIKVINRNDQNTFNDLAAVVEKAVYNLTGVLASLENTPAVIVADIKDAFANLTLIKLAKLCANKTEERVVTTITNVTAYYIYDIMPCITDAVASIKLYAEQFEELAMGAILNGKTNVTTLFETIDLQTKFISPLSNIVDDLIICLLPGVEKVVSIITTLPTVIAKCLITQA